MTDERDPRTSLRRLLAGAINPEAVALILSILVVVSVVLAVRFSSN